MLILQQKVVDGVNDLAVAVQQPCLPLGREFAIIGQNPQKFSDLKDDFLGLCLSCVDVEVRVEVFEDLEDEVTEIEGAQLVESDQGDNFLEGGLVEQ